MYYFFLLVIISLSVSLSLSLSSFSIHLCIFFSNSSRSETFFIFVFLCLSHCLSHFHSLFLSHSLPYSPLFLSSQSFLTQKRQLQVIKMDTTFLFFRFCVELMFNCCEKKSINTFFNNYCQAVIAISFFPENNSSTSLIYFPYLKSVSSFRFRRGERKRRKRNQCCQ